MPIAEDNEFTQLVAEVDSIEALFALLESKSPTGFYVSDSTKRAAARRYKDILQKQQGFADPGLIERFIPEAYGVRDKYQELFDAGLIQAVVMTSQSAAPTRLTTVSSLPGLLEQFEGISRQSAVDFDIDYVKMYINKVLTNPELVHQILSNTISWHRYNIPNQFGLREAIQNLAIIINEDNKRELLHALSNAKTVEELKSVINDKSVLIDSLGFAGGTEVIMRELLRFMNNPASLAQLHDQPFRVLDECPHLSTNSILLERFRTLAIDYEALQRQVLTDRVSAAQSVDELVLVIQEYKGDVQRDVLIKNIKQLVGNKKNIQYIADDGVFDWHEQGIIDQFGIKESIIALAKARHAYTQRSVDTASPTIQVSDDTWAQAERQFLENSDLLKLDKKKSQLSHSFLKIGDDLFAIQTNDYLGEGNYGKVKLIMNKSGDQYAVKIEGTGVEAENNAEREIMKIVGYYIAEMNREYNKEYKGRHSEHKRYTVMKLLKGHELHDHLYFGQRLVKKQVDEPTRLLMAIKAAEAIQNLHDKRIIHCDIKPENFMMNVEGDQITISSFDFGFSIKLAKGRSSVLDKPKGTDFYLAPEIEEPKYSDDDEAMASYSFASDVFALGKMFDYDLDVSSMLPDDLINNMTVDNPSLRTKLPVVIDKLYAALALTQNKSPEMKTLLKTYQAAKHSDTEETPEAGIRAKSITHRHKAKKKDPIVQPSKSAITSKHKPKPRAD